MRRRVLILALFLLLGAAINVAVAWTLPVARPYIVSEDWVEPTNADAKLANKFGEAIDDDGYVAFESGVGWKRRLIPLADTDEFEQYAHVAGFESPYLSRPRGAALTIESAGWPRVAIQGMWTWRMRRGVWMLSFDTLEIDVALGLVPLWPGFAVNTLFYAAIAWLIIRGPFALRRIIRAKRGCCVKCGYDLRGQAAASDRCPECGSAHAPSPRPSPSEGEGGQANARVAQIK